MSEWGKKPYCYPYFFTIANRTEYLVQDFIQCFFENAKKNIYPDIIKHSVSEADCYRRLEEYITKEAKKYDIDSKSSHFKQLHKKLQCFLLPRYVTLSYGAPLYFKC